MLRIPISDGKSAIPVSLQTKAPKQQQFTIYEDETAIEANSTELEKEEFETDISISHIEDLAGIYVQLMQYYHGCWAMAFILPLAEEIDEKLGFSFVQRCDAFEQESFHKGATLGTDCDWLRECSSCEEVKEGLHKLREEVLKDALFAEGLVALLTDIIQKRNEAQLQGHKFQELKVGNKLASGAGIIAGYIIDRGRGVHREAPDETYFESLEESWGRIFRLQYGWNMGKFREECVARRWAHYMHPYLSYQPYLERRSLEGWLWVYGTRVFGADITECILFGDVLNADRGSWEEEASNRLES